MVSVTQSHCRCTRQQRMFNERGRDNMSQHYIQKKQFQHQNPEIETRCLKSNNANARGIIRKKRHHGGRRNPSKASFTQVKPRYTFETVCDVLWKPQRWQDSNNPGSSVVETSTPATEVAHDRVRGSLFGDVDLLGRDRPLLAAGISTQTLRPAAETVRDPMVVCVDLVPCHQPMNMWKTFKTSKSTEPAECATFLVTSSKCAAMAALPPNRNNVPSTSFS